MPVPSNVAICAPGCSTSSADIEGYDVTFVRLRTPTMSSTI
jgi:hypothetical protein